MPGDINIPIRLDFGGTETIDLAKTSLKELKNEFDTLRKSLSNSGIEQLALALKNVEENIKMYSAACKDANQNTEDGRTIIVKTRTEMENLFNWTKQLYEQKTLLTRADKDLETQIRQSSNELDKLINRYEKLSDMTGKTDKQREKDCALLTELATKITSVRNSLSTLTAQYELEEAVMKQNAELRKYDMLTRKELQDIISKEVATLKESDEAYQENMKFVQDSNIHLREQGMIISGLTTVTGQMTKLTTDLSIATSKLAIAETEENIALLDTKLSYEEIMTELKITDKMQSEHLANQISIAARRDELNRQVALGRDVMTGKFQEDLNREAAARVKAEKFAAEEIEKIRIKAEKDKIKLADEELELEAKVNSYNQKYLSDTEKIAEAETERLRIEQQLNSAMTDNIANLEASNITIAEVKEQITLLNEAKDKLAVTEEKDIEFIQEQISERTKILEQIELYQKELVAYNSKLIKLAESQTQWAKSIAITNEQIKRQNEANRLAAQTILAVTGSEQELIATKKRLEAEILIETDLTIKSAKQAELASVNFALAESKKASAAKASAEAKAIADEKEAEAKAIADKKAAEAKAIADKKAAEAKAEELRIQRQLTSARFDSIESLRQEGKTIEQVAEQVALLKKYKGELKLTDETGIAIINKQITEREVYLKQLNTEAKLVKDLSTDTSKLAIVESDENKKLIEKSVAISLVNESIKREIELKQIRGLSDGEIAKLDEEIKLLEEKNKEIKTNLSLTKETISLLGKELAENEIVREYQRNFQKTLGAGAYSFEIEESEKSIKLVKDKIDLLNKEFSIQKNQQEIAQNQINILTEKKAGNREIVEILYKQRELLKEEQNELKNIARADDEIEAKRRENMLERRRQNQADLEFVKALNNERTKADKDASAADKKAIADKKAAEAKAEELRIQRQLTSARFDSIESLRQEGKTIEQVAEQVALLKEYKEGLKLTDETGIAIINKQITEREVYLKQLNTEAKLVKDLTLLKQKLVDLEELQNGTKKNGRDWRAYEIEIQKTKELIIAKERLVTIEGEEVQENRVVANSVTDLRNKLSLLAKQYADTTTISNVHSAQNKALAAEIRKTGDNITKLERATKSYAMGLSFADEIAKKFWSTLVRTLAMMPELLLFGAIFELFSWGADRIMKGTEALQESVKQVEDSLKSLSDERAKTNSDIAIEIEKTKELISVSQDINRSYIDRTDAIRQLRKEYRGLLQDYTDDELRKNGVPAEAQNKMIELTKLLGEQKRLKEEIGKTEEEKSKAETKKSISNKKDEIIEELQKNLPKEYKKGMVLHTQTYGDIPLKEQDFYDIKRGELYKDVYQKVLSQSKDKEDIETYRKLELMTPGQKFVENMPFRGSQISKGENKEEKELQDKLISDADKALNGKGGLRDKKQLVDKKISELNEKINPKNTLQSIEDRITVLKGDIENMKLPFTTDDIEEKTAGMNKKQTRKWAENQLKNVPLSDKILAEVHKKVEDLKHEEAVRDTLKGKEVLDAKGRQPKKEYPDAREDEEKRYRIELKGTEKKYLDKTDGYEDGDTFENRERKRRQDEASNDKHYMLMDNIIEGYAKNEKWNGEKLNSELEKNENERQGILNKFKDGRASDTADMQKWSDSNLKIISKTNEDIIKQSEKIRRELAQMQVDSNKGQKEITKAKRWNPLSAFFGGSGKSSAQDRKDEKAEQQENETNLANNVIESFGEQRDAKQKTGQARQGLSKAFGFQITPGMSDSEIQNQLADKKEKQDPAKIEEQNVAKAKYEDALKEEFRATDKHNKDLSISETTINKNTIDAEKKKRDQKIEFAKQAFEYTEKLANAAFDAQKQRIATEIANTQGAYALANQLAGNNQVAKVKLAIAEHAQIAKLKKEEAIAEREQGVLSVTIATATGIANAWKSADPILSPILTAIITASGLAQIAMITSAPLPQYAKGRRGGIAERAVLNEQGFELIESQGKFRLENEGKIGIGELQSGDTVHTHEKSLDIIKSDNFVRQLLKGTGVYSKQIEQRDAKIIFNTLSKGEIQSAFENALNKQKTPVINFPPQDVMNRRDRTAKLNGR